MTAGSPEGHSPVERRLFLLPFWNPLPRLWTDPGRTRGYEKVRCSQALYALPFPGVVLASISSGLGEVTFLALSAYYPR